VTADRASVFAPGHVGLWAKDMSAIPDCRPAVGGRMGMSLADKVRQVEATSPLITTISPPHTNTRHGSVAGENQLMPISEEQQEDSAIDSQQASNAGVTVPAEVNLRLFMHLQHTPHPLMPALSSRFHCSQLPAIPDAGHMLLSFAIYRMIVTGNHRTRFMLHARVYPGQLCLCCIAVLQ